MTLAELRTQLAQYTDLPGDTVVVLAEDAEGNGFSPLADASPAMYFGLSSFNGEHYMTEEQRQAMDDPDEYGQAPEGSVRAVFLWPTN